MNKVVGYLRLMRPANIVTAVADILAGVAISGYLVHSENVTPIFWLALSTIGLYGGGVVFNDVFDSELDKIERPERPIPRGIITVREGAYLGALLLVIAIVSALQVSTLSGMLAIGIAIAALVYDKWGKHHSFFGPINMGLCRGMNLLLGMSLISLSLSSHWFLSIVPIIYIAAITMISRSEVSGGERKTLYVAAFLYLVVFATILYVSLLKATVLPTVIFILAWALIIFLPLYKAIQQPSGKLIGKAVKAGVIAVILMNASWAAAYGAMQLSVIIILLLPLSLLLAKMFAVT